LHHHPANLICHCQVATQHDQLLLQPSAVTELHAPLADVRSHLNELDGSLQKLHTKIQLPHQSLQMLADRLDALSRASDLLRRTSRFVILARRLHSQMAERQVIPTSQQTPEDDKERAIAKAALTIAQLGSPSLYSSLPPFSILLFTSLPVGRFR
jgi:chromosome segregation ATPase